MRTALTLLFFLLGLLPLSRAEYVIANVGSNLQNPIALNELTDYFMLHRVTSPNGTKMQLYLFNKHSSITRNFILTSLNISPSAYFDMLDSYASTGRGGLPIIVDSESRMLISVALNKGGLGILRNVTLSESLKDIIIIEVK